MVPSSDSGVESPDDRSSATFSRHVSRVTDRFDALLPFAAVPFGLSIVDVEKFRRALDPAPGSFSINVEFAFPTPLLDLWGFVEPPPSATRGDAVRSAAGTRGGLDRGPMTGPTDTGGAEVAVETPLEPVALPLEAIDAGLLGWIGTVLLAYAVVAAVIAAGYLGGIDRRLRDEPAAPLACVVRYAPRFLAYYVLAVGAFAFLAALLVVAPPLLLLAFPAALAVGYLFYAVPFLFVVDDARLLEAFRRSHGLALEGGPYVRFAVGHVIAAAVTSFLLSIAVSVGGAGVLLALVVATPLALVLTAATVSFLQELAASDGIETVGGV